MKKSFTIDIKGIDKVAILKYWWTKNKPPPNSSSLFGCNPNIPFNDEEAKEAVKKYIKKFCGRKICLDLSTDTLIYDGKLHIEDEDNVEESHQFLCDVVDNIRNGTVYEFPEDPFEMDDVR